MASYDSAGHHIRDRPIGTTSQPRMVFADASKAQSYGCSNLLDAHPVSHISHILATLKLTQSENSTIALSIIRQIYTVKLSTSTTDISLSSTLVTILMAVEVTYALISCTLTTSSNFTSGFSTGFGMGHMPGAAESYNMSAVASSSNPRTHRGGADGHKSNMSTVRGTNVGTRSSVGYRSHVKTPSYEDDLADGPLQLRPSQQGLECRTIVQGGDHRYWGESESLSSDHDDLGIVRHTEYSVSHDEAPILQKHILYQS